MKQPIIITAFGIFTFTLWWFVGSYKLFFIMMWLQFILLNGALMFKSSIPERYGWEVGMLSCFLIGLLDEVFWSPDKLQLNDYFFFGLLCVYSIFKYLKYQRCQIGSKRF